MVADAQQADRVLGHEVGERLDGLGQRHGWLLDWQGVGPIIDPPWRPTLIYPARGLELLWEPGSATPAALAAVIGRSRARLLTSLGAPRSTTELARRRELTAGAVSQHLKALRAAGLVTATRHGREVLYLRTEPAQRLLASASQGRAPTAHHHPAELLPS